MIRAPITQSEVAPAKILETEGPRPCTPVFPRPGPLPKEPARPKRSGDPAQPEIRRALRTKLESHRKASADGYGHGCREQNVQLLSIYEAADLGPSPPSPPLHTLCPISQKLQDSAWVPHASALGPPICASAAMFEEKTV